MLKEGSLAGIWVAMMTPFDGRGRIDVDRLVRHGRMLLGKGVRGLSLFGTTGEGTALSWPERQRTLEAVIKAGIAAEAIVPGTSVTDAETTVEVTRHAGALGCPAVLVLPPFFMKGVSEAGIEAHYRRVAEGLAGESSPARLMLYNIPEHSGVAIAPATLRRLADAYPGLILGVKDSSGTRESALAFLDAAPDLDVLVGDEHLLDLMKGKGGAGLLCGMANLVPELIVGAWNETGTTARAKLQTAIDRAIDCLSGHSFLPAAKAAYAGLSGDDAWLATRPPLEPLAAAIGRKMADALHRIENEAVGGRAPRQAAE